MPHFVIKHNTVLWVGLCVCCSNDFQLKDNNVDGDIDVVVTKWQWLCDDNTVVVAGSLTVAGDDGVFGSKP